MKTQVRYAIAKHCRIAKETSYADLTTRIQAARTDLAPIGIAAGIEEVTRLELEHGDLIMGSEYLIFRRGYNLRGAKNPSVARHPRLRMQGGAQDIECRSPEDFDCRLKERKTEHSTAGNGVVTINL